ncbi:MAG: type IV pilus assembly protein PilM [Phycisphaerales bacterium]|jgi:type IV pilus assembly protein PilM|nr:type IV pilus assembly protein PilM [Phycisphaerales bacterium]
MASNASWGIEIGSGAIKAIRIEQDGERVRATDFDVVVHPKVLSEPGVDVEDVLRVSLGTLASRHDFSKVPVCVSIPGHSSFSRFAKLPPVEPKKVPDIVKFEAVQQIPFPLEEVEWDFQTFVSPDSPDVEVGIFAVTRERIMQALMRLQDVGITPTHIQLSPVAVYNAMAYDLEFTERTPGTVVLDVGTSSTDLIVADAGRVWIRTFPLGGHNFTMALAEAFNVGYPKAEKLKRETEESKHARQIFQAMRPVFGDLAQDVQRSIGFYMQTHRDSNLTRMIGLGATFHLPGLRKFLKQQIGMEVYRVDDFKRLTPPSGREGDLNTAAMQMATAYGCALQGLGLDTIKANLMPVKVVREAMWRGKAKWFGVAAGLAVAAGAAAFITPMRDQAAIQAAVKPREIDQAIRAFNDKKREADEAGVTSGAGEFQVAAVADLAASSAVYTHIAIDVGDMLADATAKNGGAPAYELKRLSTTWAGPGVLPGAAIDAGNSGFEDPSAAQRRDEREGGHGGGPRGGGGGPRGYVEPPPEDPSMDPEPSSVGGGGGSVNQHGMVKVDLDLVLSHDRPTEFLFGSVQQWLKDHAAREGWPYTLEIGPRFEYSVTTLAAADSATGSREVVRGGRNTGSNPRGEQSSYDIRRREEESRYGNTGDAGGIAIQQEGGSPRGAFQGTTVSGGGDPNTIAPIEAPAPAADGPTKSTVRVTFYAVVRGPAGAASEDEGNG